MGLGLGRSAGAARSAASGTGLRASVAQHRGSAGHGRNMACDRPADCSAPSFLPPCLQRLAQRDSTKALVRALMLAEMGGPGCLGSLRQAIAQTSGLFARQALLPHLQRAKHIVLERVAADTECMAALARCAAAGWGARPGVRAA